MLKRSPCGWAKLRRTWSAAFRSAAEQNAVLFFDEADAIAMRRSAGVATALDRESNVTINVLLRELEAFNGIVIFATNLAANFDPAFERRIRTHVLFEMPGVEERARIWQLQVHPRKTPLAPDVDFRVLSERYAMSGGDIKNAVIKAAAAAAAEPGADIGKRYRSNISRRGSKKCSRQRQSCNSRFSRTLRQQRKVPCPCLCRGRNICRARAGGIRIVCGASGARVGAAEVKMTKDLQARLLQSDRPS